jgi:hypothetical protein
MWLNIVPKMCSICDALSVLSNWIYNYNDIGFVIFAQISKFSSSSSPDIK